MVDLPGLCQDIDWMSNEEFVNFLRHFVYFIKPTKDQTVVLILNCQVIHTKNLAAIEMSHEAGVVMVSLLPHTNHRLQPLDVTFFGPFGK